MGEVVFSPSFDRFEDGAGRESVRLGHRLVDLYLELVAARARPNTVLRSAGLCFGSANSRGGCRCCVACFVWGSGGVFAWLCCASDFARQVLSFFKQHRAGLAVLGQEAAAYEFRA